MQMPFQKKLSAIIIAASNDNPHILSTLLHFKCWPKLVKYFMKNAKVLAFFSTFMVNAMKAQKTIVKSMKKYKI